MFQRREVSRDRFDVDAFVARMFVETKTNDASYWKRCVKLVRGITSCFANALIQAGLKDATLIRKYLCRLILSSSDQDYIDTTCLYDYSSSLDVGALGELTNRLSAILYTLKNGDIQHFVSSLLSEESEDSANNIIDLFVACSRRKFDIGYLRDFIRIYQFLAHPDKVISYIDQLEEALQNHAGSLSQASDLLKRKDGKYLLPLSSENPYARQKILSGYLYQWAGENGFEQRAKMFIQLSSETFFGLLASKSIFKDNAVIIGDTHGAWSHVLQWYFIIEHNKKHPFLEHLPADVYQKLGDPAFLGSHRPVALPWDILFDAYAKNNFTSPEFVTHSLLQHPERWPLLTESVRRLQDKMFHQFGGDDAYLAYLIEKHQDVGQAGFIARSIAHK